ncbi:uncharacterized protein N7496_002007 [Penicillium cataractarum]|uniref:TMEM205-like domain-containing protein n=1 Tax=Penicillium cataractarum TaxID=2100454 RepID=A0A9W9VXF1_9EURO|nr:uncharacterized protein N7496_002007 [Penicillium cataractarum]KAJ5390939.1 hypothetical protein N7496_002007 [Penicillium cataractarum]
MGGFLHTVGSLLPYHLLSYGALLGTEVYQSFVNTKLCFQALPMREFLALQKRLFPVYFKCQVCLAALTAATHPPYSILSLARDPLVAVPLVVVLITGSLNWFVFGPRTTTASLVRRALGESEDKAADPSEGKLHRANRDFARNHAMSIHLNAIALVATIWYGFSLSSSLLPEG